MKGVGRLSNPRISIHAPREGSDNRVLQNKAANKLFQSTLPVRGATHEGYAVLREEVISIHAPREGSDAASPATR